jgi:hypothetical protein
MEEIRKNNMEILRQEKLKIEEEYKRNTLHYQLAVRNYQQRLKEAEDSQEELVNSFNQQKEKLQNEIKSNVINNLTQKIQIQSISDNLAIIEKDNEGWKKLIEEYKNFIQNLHKSKEDPDENIDQASTIQNNFQVMFKNECEEKVKS